MVWCREELFPLQFRPEGVTKNPKENTDWRHTQVHLSLGLPHIRTKVNLRRSREQGGVRAEGKHLKSPA